MARTVKVIKSQSELHTWLLTTTRATACWTVSRDISPWQLHAKTTQLASRLLLSLYTDRALVNRVAVEARTR